MIRSACLLSLSLLLVGCAEPERWRGLGRVDETRAFYYPRFGRDTDLVLGKVADRSIDAATYFRYLAGRFGTRFVEDLAFDIALERECKARGLARSAPVLARSMAAMRFKESGRKRGSDPDHSSQRKFANEALRKLRVDAIAADERSKDDDALQGLFNRRYGVDGQSVKVRHILVSLDRTRQRMAGDPAKSKVIAEALRRATEMRQQIDRGTTFASLVPKTDDRQAKRMLRSPKHRAAAGTLQGYNYQRFGEPFAQAVRRLRVGEISSPVLSETGFHLIELLERTVTKRADVAAALRKELRRGPAKPAEATELRERLLRQYGFERR